MGAWSSKIMGNDTSCEVNEYFKRMYLYQEGNKFKWSVDDIADSLLTYYEDAISNHASIKCDFFFGLAESLWQVGKMNKAVLTIVKTLVDSGTDTEAAKSLEASEKYLKERQAAVKAFIKKIKEDNPNPKTRELKPQKLSTYLFGDCISVLCDGFYYGLVVVNDARNTDDGTNQFAFVNIKQQKKPALADFEKANYLVSADIAAALSNNPGDAGLDIIFTFTVGKSQLLKEVQFIEKTGSLPFTRGFYERQSVRVTDFPGKIPSLVKLVKNAADYWDKREWKVSDYKVVSFVKNRNTDLSKGKVLLQEKMIALSDVYVSIKNSLWHINVSVYIAKSDISKYENEWLSFAAAIEEKTGREINLFQFAQEKGNEMLPFTKVDFKKYELKHVRHYKII